jgi:DNA-binding transcriptional MerR regulator
MSTAELPNRALFRAPEVCEIAKLQPYVLRSWEAEFPDLGVTRAGARVYRRGDVERVLRLKHLLFVEGLTLAGARRRLEEERAPLPEIDDSATEAPSRRDASAARADQAVRRQLGEVRRGLQSLLALLEKRRESGGAFELRVQTDEGPSVKTKGRTEPTSQPGPSEEGRPRKAAKGRKR